MVRDSRLKTTIDVMMFFVLEGSLGNVACVAAVVMFLLEPATNRGWMKYDKK
jgi:hypothetical protein